MSDFKERRRAFLKRMEEQEKQEQLTRNKTILEYEMLLNIELEKNKKLEEGNLRVREQANEFFKSNRELKQRLKEAEELIRLAKAGFEVIENKYPDEKFTYWLNEAKKWERENE